MCMVCAYIINKTEQEMHYRAIAAGFTAVHCQDDKLQVIYHTISSANLLVLVIITACNSNTK